MIKFSRPSGLTLKLAFTGALCASSNALSAAATQSSTQTKISTSQMTSTATVSTNINPSFGVKGWGKTPTSFPPVETSVFRVDEAKNLQDLSGKEVSYKSKNGCEFVVGWPFRLHEEGGEDPVVENPPQQTSVNVEFDFDNPVVRYPLLINGTLSEDCAPTLGAAKARDKETFEEAGSDPTWKSYKFEESKDTYRSELFVGQRGYQFREVQTRKGGKTCCISTTMYYWPPDEARKKPYVIEFTPGTVSAFRKLSKRFRLGHK